LIGEADGSQSLRADVAYQECVHNAHRHIEQLFARGWQRQAERLSGSGLARKEGCAGGSADPGAGCVRASLEVVAIHERVSLCEIGRRRIIVPSEEFPKRTREDLPRRGKTFAPEC